MPSVDHTDCHRASIMKINAKQLDKLDKLDIASGFSHWVRTVDEKSKEELKHLFNKRLMGEDEVWVATTDSLIVGFAIISEWTALPGGKIVDAVEVAKPYRDWGIGSKLLRCILQENQDAVVGLILYPELGYEPQLTAFYKNMGFEQLSEWVMVRLPTRRERLEVLAIYLRELRDLSDRLLKAIESEPR